MLSLLLEVWCKPPDMITFSYDKMLNPSGTIQIHLYHWEMLLILVPSFTFFILVSYHDFILNGIIKINMIHVFILNGVINKVLSFDLYLSKSVSYRRSNIISYPNTPAIRKQQNTV